MTWGAVLLGSLMLGAVAVAQKQKPGLFDFQKWRTPEGHQRDAIQQLAPHRLDLTPAGPFGGEPRRLRIRIYADRDYRSMTMHWHKGFEAQVGRVNRVVEAVFNVRLEIESMRDWDRSHVGADLEAIQNELEILDPGGDTDWTIGLVTPFKGVARSIHQIGGAHLLARHFVLRGMDDEKEGQALDREFGLLSPEERGRTYSERKMHKETVVFLHEWAHTMGVLHDENDVAVMHPIYDAKRAAFSEFQKRLISFVIERRLAAPEQASPESTELGALLREAPVDEGNAKERASLIALAESRSRRTRPGADGGNQADAGKHVEARVLDLPAADVDAFNKAIAALNAQHLDEAWLTLAPLVGKFPKHPVILSLGCWLVAGQPHAAEARAACDAALIVAAKDARAPLDAAAAYVRQREFGAAVPLLGVALPRIAERDAKEWIRLASLAVSVGALSMADTALGHVGRGQERQRLAEQIETQRMRSALPRSKANWGLKPEDEPTYAAQFQEVAEMIGSGNIARARVRLTEFRRTFPDPPGCDVLECELEIGAKRLTVAGKACEAALRKSDHAIRAHTLLGSIAARQHRDTVAEKHLRRAIVLDPRDPGPWRELGRLYRATRAGGRLAELAAQHEALLSAPLPE